MSRDQFGAADHLERHVDPAGHDAVHRVDEPLVPGRRACGWRRGCSASASFLGLVSTATIVVAPAIRAPCTTLSPTPPQPIDRDRLARLHVGDVEHRPEAGRHAAPGEADHVERDARDRPSPSGRPAAPRPRRGSRSPTIGYSGAPPSCAGGCEPSAIRPAIAATRAAPSHSTNRPVRHDAHCAARAVEREHHVIARRTLVTPSPTASTTPAPSWPSTIGNASSTERRARRAGPTRRCPMRRRAPAPHRGAGASTSISSSAAAPSAASHDDGSSAHGVTSTAGPTIERS